MNRIFTSFACFLVMLTMTISMAFAQSITISGTVTDKQTNETLPGVSINVKGKSIGTSSSDKIPASCNSQSFPRGE